MPATIDRTTGIHEATDVRESDRTPWETVERERERSIRDGIRMHCRDQLEACVGDPSSAMTQRDVELWMESMEERLLGGETETEKTRIAQEMGGRYAQDFIRQTRIAGAIIDRAERKKWILPAKAAEWRRRMKQGTWNEKKDFILNPDVSPGAHTLRAFARNWEGVAKDYKSVLKLEKDLKITKEEIAAHAELAGFHDAAMMSGRLKYPERRWRIDCALSFLKSFRRKELGEKKDAKEPASKSALEAKARRELQRAIDAKAVDGPRAMHWLQERVLCKPVQKLQKYIEVDLRAYVQNCIKTRVDFDYVQGEMEKNGVPQGFNRISLAKFLALTLGQRKGYVEQARRRLQLAEAASSPEMSNLKLGIQHALDTGDWEEASDLIKKARHLLGSKKNPERDRYDLDSMERYMNDFREKEKIRNKPKEDATQTLAKMRAAFEKIAPESLKSLYLKTMNEGPECFSRFCQLLGNREWVTLHGYSDPEREKWRAEKAKNETKDRAEGHHGKKGEECVDLDLADDPEHLASVRGYDHGEWAPTYIFMSHLSHGKLLDILRKRQDNYAFGYWTTLMPKEANYEQQLHLIHDVNRTLKSGLRHLRQQGFLFTRTGPPVSLN